MAHLARRPDRPSPYTVRWADPDGTEHRRSFKTYGEARPAA